MRSIFILWLLGAAALAVDTPTADVCTRTNRAQNGSALLPEQEALARLDVSSDREAYTLEGAPYAKVHPGDGTELGRAAREMEELGLSLAVSRNWHARFPTGKEPYYPREGVLVLPESAVASGKLDGATRREIDKLKREHRHLLDESAELLNQYQVRHREIEIPEQGRVLEILPDAVTPPGRYAKEMKDIGVSVYVDGLGLERGKGLAVYRPDSKSVSIAHWVLEKGKGEPGIVAEHEADHARREHLEQAGVDSVFHGHISPPVGESFDTLPEAYQRGFSIDEARGHVKAAAGFTREWLEVRSKERLGDAAERKLIEFALGTLEDGRILSSYTSHVAETTLGGLAGKMTQPVVTKGPWYRGLFASSPAPEVPESLVRTILLGRPGDQTFPREITIGLGDQGHFTYSHLAKDIPLPRRSPFSFGGRTPQPDEGPFLKSVNGRVNKLKSVHDEYVKKSMILEVAIKRAQFNKFSAESMAGVTRALKELEDAILPLTTPPE